MKSQSITGGGLDFVGDIHGQFDKLMGLLETLGYKSHGAHGFRHPEGRRIVFLGDYIDRGPKIRETLLTVRAMVESGDALAIMGNHEFNAIAFSTPTKNGSFLRRHTEKNCHQHEATLTQFQNELEEWRNWLSWFKKLPMWLDLGSVRAVHACWHSEGMEVLAGHELSDESFMEACSTKGTAEYEAVETILKGPEVDLPSGIIFTDKQGIERSRIRSCWWEFADERDPVTYTKLAMPPGTFECHLPVPAIHLASVPRYRDPIPVLIGHYWLPPDAEKAPLAPNIACLDYSAGLGGPLMAYRWEGETALTGNRMIMAAPHP